MKTLFSFLFLSLLFSIGACSSKQKQPDSGKKDGSLTPTLTISSDSDSGTAGSLKTIHFIYNEYQLDQKARASLTKNADFLRQYPHVTIEIEGHCDERGGRQYNLALGERRAKMIKDYLTALGIKSYRMKTVSFGNEKPLADGSDENSWSKNRRGNFVVTGI